MGILDQHRRSGVSGQVKSTASIIAIIAAIGSFVLSAQDHGFFALMAAGVGIVAGLLGALRAASPRVSGGILSLSAIALSAIAVLVALVALIL